MTNNNIARLLKKFGKFIGYFLLFCIAFLGIYWLLATGLSRIVVPAEANAPQEIPIYLLTNGVHTDIVMPVKTAVIDWSKKMPFHNTLGKDTSMNFLAIGWGDKGFYLQTPTWADLKFSVAFKATFGLSTSALHATYYKAMKLGEDCVTMNISKAQYSRLITFIEESLQTDENGNYIFIPTDQVYGKADAFYEANGSYNLTHTCNTWTNNALKAAGQKAAWWTPFDEGIFRHYLKE